MKIEDAQCPFGGTKNRHCAFFMLKFNKTMVFWEDCLYGDGLITKQMKYYPMWKSSDRKKFMGQGARLFYQTKTKGRMCYEKRIFGDVFKYLYDFDAVSGGGVCR